MDFPACSCANEAGVSRSVGGAPTLLMGHKSTALSVGYLLYSWAFVGGTPTLLDVVGGTPKEECDASPCMESEQAEDFLRDSGQAGAAVVAGDDFF